MDRSEVAQLRQRIALECQASWWGLHALNAGMAQHHFITARFKQMEHYHRHLTELVGEEQATDILCEEFEREGAAHGSQQPTGENALAMEVSHRPAGDHP